MTVNTGIKFKDLKRARPRLHSFNCFSFFKLLSINLFMATMLTRCLFLPRQDERRHDAKQNSEICSEHDVLIQYAGKKSCISNAYRGKKLQESMKKTREFCSCEANMNLLQPVCVCPVLAIVNIWLRFCLQSVVC